MPELVAIIFWTGTLAVQHMHHPRIFLFLNILHRHTNGKIIDAVLDRLTGRNADAVAQATAKAGPGGKKPAKPAPQGA